MSTELLITGIPFALTPSRDSRWNVDPQTGRVDGVAAPHSDIFIDPGGGSQVNAETLLNAATLLGKAPDGDFQLSAQVTVDFAAKYDAGVLLLWIDEKFWAKLCFEFSPAGEPMVVSVVNRDVSDDANGFVVDGRSVGLRVSRVGQVYAFHASTDGRNWRLIRAFALDAPSAPLQIGLEAQSPVGEGCAVTFEHARFQAERLSDLRDGS
jgi:regulation of enolase protein 1 (concanavalin A-like superfamily)